MTPHGRRSVAPVLPIVLCHFHRRSGLCLVTGASTANGALVELRTCNANPTQQ
jgi:hypothetical protein